MRERHVAALLALLTVFLVVPYVAAAATERGTIAVRLHACPEGMRPLDLDPARCPLDASAADLQIFVAGSGENQRDLAGATREGDRFTWDGLPFGEYVLQVTEFPSGYDRYLVPGQSGLNMAPDLGYTAGPNEGYLLPLEATHAGYELDVYVFRALENSGSMRLDVRFWQCPAGVAAAPDMRGLGCVALDTPPDGLRLEIAGAEVASPLTLNQTTRDDGALGWDDVPGGEYRLTARLPQGTAGYAARSYDPALRLQLFSDRSGYALVLSPESMATPTAVSMAQFDVYLLP